MARTILQDCDRVIASPEYQTWAASHPTDDRKVKYERQGNRRPTANDSRARVLIEAIRAGLAAEQPAPPAPTLGIFAGRYGYLRDDQSGYETEKLSALRDAGYAGVALNVIDHPSGEWGVWRTNAVARGLWAIPWGRCSTIPQVQQVRAVAEQWGSPGLIVNLEQEATEPRWLVTGEQVATALAGYVGSIGISTEPYMPENFNWLPLILAGAIDLPQACVNETPPFTPQQVVDRAKVFGWTLISPSFATYTTPTLDPARADYQWAGPFGIYTVDDLAPGEIATWV